MKTILASAAVAALAGGIWMGSSVAQEHPMASPGFVGDVKGIVVTDSVDDCVRTGSSTAESCRPAVEPMAAAAPAPAHAAPLAERITLKGMTLFDFDKATLKPQAREVLDDTIAEIKKKLQSYDVENRHMTVTGHTDSVGSDAYNQRLSERRAAAVKAYLVEHGIGGPIEARGLGESRPVASNTTAAGREQNRRVEIALTGLARPKT